MKDTQFDIEPGTGVHTHSKKYMDAVRALETAKKRREQQGYAAMYIASGMAGGAKTATKPNPVVALARNFCILFAFAVPNLLLIYTVF